MTDDYLAAKIHEALQASSQDRQDAAKLLITWAVRDQALLLALAKPHLKAIVTARIEHEVRGKKTTGVKQTEFKSGDIDQILASKKPLGDRRNANVPPPKTSQRQANVMKQLAEAFKKKK